MAAESDRPGFGAHWTRSWSTGSTAVNELIIPQMFTTLLLFNGDSVARTPTLNLVAADYI